MYCASQVHTLRNTCVHTQMTKFTLQSTQVHIHRNTHVHRDIVKCTLSHSQTHVFRTPHAHIETLTEAASQQTGTQRTRSVQGCTHTCTQRHKDTVKSTGIDTAVSLHLYHCTQVRTCTHAVLTDAHTDNMYMCPGHPTQPLKQRLAYRPSRHMCAPDHTHNCLTLTIAYAYPHSHCLTQARAHTHMPKSVDRQSHEYTLILTLVSHVPTHASGFYVTLLTRAHVRILHENVCTGTCSHTGVCTDTHVLFRQESKLFIF